MRFIALASLVFLVAIGGLVACNSNEMPLVQSPKAGATPQPPPPPPADNARRITVAELHHLYEKNNVLIFDTRADTAYKDEHIKGSISIPTGTVLARVDELPRDKMIVAYCT